MTKPGDNATDADDADAASTDDDGGKTMLGKTISAAEPYW